MRWKVRLNRESYFYELDKHVCVTVTELRFDCSLLKSQYSRDKCCMDRKVCFIVEADHLGRRWLDRFIGDEGGVPGLMLSMMLSSSTWVRALVPAEQLNCIFMFLPWWRTKILLYHHTIVSWFLLCFFSLSLFWLATAWICVLELREGLMRLHEVHFLQTRNRDMKRICTHMVPTTFCLGSLLKRKMKEE